MRLGIFFLVVLFLAICSPSFSQNDFKKKIEADFKKLVESYMKDFSAIKGTETYRESDDLIYYKSSFVFTNSADTNNYLLFDNQLDSPRWSYSVRIYENDINTSIEELKNQILEVLDNMKFSFGKLTNVGVPMAAGTPDENRPNYIYTGKKKANGKIKDLHISVDTWTDENNSKVLYITIDDRSGYFRL